MDNNPTSGFEKLQFLLQQVSCPPGKTHRTFCSQNSTSFSSRGYQNPLFFSCVILSLVKLTETFANLLLLYVKHDYYDLAADVLAENSHLTFKCLSSYLYDFIDAKITQQTSPDEVGSTSLKLGSLTSGC